MRIKLRKIVILFSLSVLFIFTGVLVACQKNNNGAHIDVPEKPVEVELGSYSLSEMPNVVDKDGTILSGYEVSIKSVTDESGEAFSYANNMLVVSSAMVIKVTYQAKGLDDAVLTLDFADRTAPGLEFKDEGFPMYYFTGQTYSIPTYSLTGGDVNYSKTKIVVSWLETEDAEPEKIVENELSFKVEKTSGFYKIEMYFEDKSGNGKTYEFIVPVGAPENPVVGEDLYGIVYFEDVFYDVQTTDVRSTMDFKTMTRDELPDEVKAGADESITGATKMWHARKDSLDDGDYLEISLPYITNIRDYNYLYFDVYNASEYARYLLLVPTSGNWVNDTRAWVKPNSWTRVIFDTAQIERLGGSVLSDFTGTRLYIQPLREGTLDGADKEKPCVIGEEQTALYMTNWYVSKESPAEIGENGSKDPNAADRIFYFDGPGGSSYLRNMSYEAEPIYYMSASYAADVKDPEVPNGDGMTKITRTSTSTDSIGVMRMVGAHIHDLDEYAAVAFRIYNPNNYNIGFGYNTSHGLRQAFTVKPGWNTLIFSLDHIETLSELGKTYGRSLNSLVVIIKGLQAQGDCFYLGAAYGIKAEDLEASVTEFEPETVFKGEMYQKSSISVRVKDSCKFEWAQGVELVENLKYALTSAEIDENSVEVSDGVFVPEKSGTYTLTYSLMTYENSKFYDSVAWGEDITVTADITISDYEADWILPGKVLYFDTPAGVSQIKYNAGTNRFAVSFDEEVKDEAVAGGLGMTKMTNSLTGNSDGEYILQNPYLTDISEYSALAWRIYNPNDHEINIGYNSSGNRYNYPVAAKSFGTIVFSLDHMLNLAQFINNTEKGNINGLVLIIRNVAAGESFYMGAAFGIKSTDIGAAEYDSEIDADVYTGSLYSDYGANNVVVKDNCAYEWARGIKVQNINYIVKSVKYAGSDVAFTFNKGATNVMSFKPEQSGVYTLAMQATVLQGSSYTTTAVNWQGAEAYSVALNIILVEFDESWKQDDKVFYFDTPAGMSNVIWNTKANTNRIAISFDESVKDTAVAGGLGMTKLTSYLTGNSDGEYYLQNPFISDLSGYAALALRVYNPNDHEISIGYNSSGANRYNFPVAAKTYGTIVFSLDHMLNYAENVMNQDGNVNNAVLIIRNVAAGESFYLGAAYALKSSDISVEEYDPEISADVYSGSLYSEYGAYDVVVSDTCKYEWARGTKVQNINYIIKSVKYGDSDVAFTFNKGATNVMSFEPEQSGAYTLTMQAAVLNGTSYATIVDWDGAEVFSVTLNINLVNFDESWTKEDKVLYFDTPAGMSNVIWNTKANTNRITISFDENVKDPAVEGGLGMTKLTSYLTGNSDGEYFLQNPFISDLSGYAALALRVYNPNDHQINIGYNSSYAERYNFAVPANSYSTLVFSLDHMLNFAQQVSGGNINNAVLIIRNVAAGESFYLGAAYGIKGEDLVCNVTSLADAEVEEGDSYQIADDAYAFTVEVGDTCKYEWARGVKVQNICYAVQGVKLDGAEVDFDSSAMTFVPKTSGKYVIELKATVLKKYVFNPDTPVNWNGNENITLEVNVTVGTQS